GVYAQDGRALIRSGTAPLSLSSSAVLDAPSLFDIRRSSLVMKRPLGPEIPGMPGLRQGRGLGGGMGGMMRPLPLNPRPPQAPLLGEAANPRPFRPLLAAPRSLWIEYGLGGFWRERGLLLLGALVATAGALALYLVLFGLYRRNLVLSSREAKNRELLQLGEAAGTLVHEIKNPLGIIRVQAASLRRLGSPEASAKADAIEEEVVRLAGLADRIRAFLKGGEGQAVDLDLVPWLRDYVARYSAGPEAASLAGACIALCGLPEKAEVRIDPERLGQALDNLVANAREASSNGHLPEISLVRRNGHPPLWELEVSDRGIGVPPEIEERIFEPFFTTKTQGSGIGLALARRIARAGGGELNYRPREGGGSVFFIQLPARL
ncbi:MAG TPA: HAMP domain-containing sensor histidine kinase, partial [Rectinemataceae bacterium]|nr:HAMP domain-containing sensor histidine kinase [Rectinemataceae bacterium]